MSANESHDESPYIREAKRIFTETKKKGANEVTDTINEATAIVREKDAHQDLIDLTNPKYKRLANIISKVEPLQKELAETHKDDDEWLEIVRIADDKSFMRGGQAMQRVRLLIGKGHDGNIFYRTERQSALYPGMETTLDAVQLTEQNNQENNKLFKVQLTAIINDPADRTPVQRIELVPPQEVIKKFYQHAEILVPTPGPIEKGKKLMRRIFRKETS